MPSSQPSQWQYLLKNAGKWRGSCMLFSPAGQLLSESSVEAELAPKPDSPALLQEVRRYLVGSQHPIQTANYSSHDKSLLCFENGSFSQGSMQWTPRDLFGAELCLMAGKERVRLTVQFDESGQLQPMTLLTETLGGSTCQTRTSFTPEDFVGSWQGESIIRFANGRPVQHGYSQQTTEWFSNDTIREPELVVDDVPILSSTGTVRGQTIQFQSGSTQTSQLIMLPNGCFCRCPVQANPRKTLLFIELGWITRASEIMPHAIANRTCQRIRRIYDASGAWEKLIFCTETAQK